MSNHPVTFPQDPAGSGRDPETFQQGCLACLACFTHRVPGPTAEASPPRAQCPRISSIGDFTSTGEQPPPANHFRFFSFPPPCEGEILRGTHIHGLQACPAPAAISQSDVSPFDVSRVENEHTDTDLAPGLCRAQEACAGV